MSPGPVRRRGDGAIARIHAGRARAQPVVAGLGIDKEGIGSDVALTGIPTLHARIGHDGDTVVPVADLHGVADGAISPKDTIGF